eukprot:gene20630-24732_t
MYKDLPMPHKANITKDSAAGNFKSHPLGSHEAKAAALQKVKDKLCKFGILRSTFNQGNADQPSKRRLVCCPKFCGDKCSVNSCSAYKADSQYYQQCCPKAIVEHQNKCDKGEPPCQISMDDPNVPDYLSNMLATAKTGSEIMRNKTRTGSSSIAFVVWYASPASELSDTSHKYKSAGTKKSVPTWSKFDSNMDKMSKMIQMNFESARLTHPGCRLVILTDENTVFTPMATTVEVPGPPVEVVRIAGLDVHEEMISRMKARIKFLASEKTTARSNLILLDTDMLIMKSMAKVFDSNFDIAATWRHDASMPINGGVIFLKREKLSIGQQFFEDMLDITLHAKSKSAVHRWFGMSDQ